MSFTYSNIQIIFADQLRTLAIYNKSTEQFLSRYILREYDDTDATSKYHLLKLSNDSLTIEALDTAPSDVDEWTNYNFTTEKAAADIWQSGNNIIIGMGDIRGFASEPPPAIPATIDKYELTGNGIYITATGFYQLRLGRKV